MFAFLIMIAIVAVIVGAAVLLKSYLKGKRSLVTGIGATILPILGYLDQVPLIDFVEGREGYLLAAGVGILFTAFTALKSTDH